GRFAIGLCRDGQALPLHAGVEHPQNQVKNAIIGDYSIFAGFYDGFRGPCIVSYGLGPNIRTRKAKRCLVRVSIDLIPPNGVPRLPTYHRQRSSPIAAMTSGNPVPAVGTPPIGTSSPNGRCTTWAISTCGVRVLSWGRV